MADTTEQARQAYETYLGEYWQTLKPSPREAFADRLDLLEMSVRS